MPFAIAIAKTARQIIESPVSDLILGPNMTNSMAIHRIWAVAPIYQWNDFEQNVRQQCNVAQLSQRQLAHFPTNFASEHHIAKNSFMAGMRALSRRDTLRTFAIQ
jgi:hypothetical protein